MFDTNVTIVGNVLTAPEWRRTTNTNSLVANFKVASTARRLDRETGRWIDGNSLRVRVNCWRKLAEGVASSVMVGDPVVVVGRLYTRDWTDVEGNPRTLYEMEAVAVGHDLARGRGKFQRNRPTLATSAVEDAQADTQVRGEATVPVPREAVPARPGEGLFDDGDPDFVDAPPRWGHSGLDRGAPLSGGRGATAPGGPVDAPSPYDQRPVRRADGPLTGSGARPPIDESDLDDAQLAAEAAAFTAALDDAASDDGPLDDGALEDAALDDGGLENGSLGDGAAGDRALGDGALGDRALGDGALGDRALGDGALGDGALGDGALGDGALGQTAVDSGAVAAGGHLGSDGGGTDSGASGTAASGRGAPGGQRRGRRVGSRMSMPA